MIKVKCSKCKEELKELGGVAFSPPNPSGSVTRLDVVLKAHLCLKCWKLFQKWIFK